MRPHLTLRLGFAGNINLPEGAQAHRAALDAVLAATARHLATIPGGTGNKGASAFHVSDYYEKNSTTIRLVTGLAEGGDTEAYEALKRLAVPQVAKELAAVLGCDVQNYHDSRSAAHQAAFRTQLSECAYVQVLDGAYVAGDAGRSQRARLYRAQADVLLRHADILVALADPDTDGKAGGTVETVRKALAFELPVVFIHVKTGEIALIEPGKDLTAVLTDPQAWQPSTGGLWRSALERWITTIVADPDAGLPVPGHNGGRSDKRAEESRRFLTEYFNPTGPFRTKADGTRRATGHERVWNRFAARFDRGPKPGADPSLAPLSDYRRRATALNYHYSGLYRGAFVLNYALAVLAVFCAALSLVIIGKQKHTPLGETFSHVVAVTGPEHPPAATAAPPFPVALAVLGAIKLVCLLFIYINTHRAKHGKWNERAVDYRYLAERLRTMLYLPRLGSFQPPAASPPQYASRVVRQSAVDWLFEAITRSVSPAVLATPTVVQLHGNTLTVPLITMDAQQELTVVKDHWIRNQVAYHERNAGQMSAMDRFLEKWGGRLNKGVIGLVVLDLLVLLLMALDDHGLLTGQLATVVHGLHDNAYWLVFGAAVIPAAVASLNGIRFQSECQRLAERSAVVRVVLAGHSAQPAGRQKEAEDLLAAIRNGQGSPADPGSWNADVLRLGEAVANDLVQEVAEWSVLYAKEMAEP